MPETPNISTPSLTLKIWQQNVNRSLIAQLDVLESANPKDYDLIFLQEPYMDHLGATRASTYWAVIYPPRHRDAPGRSRILVNKRLSTSAWTQINVQSFDITAIQLNVNEGTLHAYNIYNDCKHNDSLTTLAEHLRRAEHRGIRTAPQYMIWAGDFNRHHPLWDKIRNSHLFTEAAIKDAQPLLDMLGIHQMKMALPRDIATLESTATKNWTRVDNVFCTADLLQDFILCDADPSLRPANTAHFPVLSTIDVSPKVAKEKQRRNFRGTDWVDFWKALKEKLEGLEKPREFRMGEREAFEAARKKLEWAVMETIQEQVLMAKPSPHSKRWWTRELSQMKASMQKSARQSQRAQGIQNSPTHEEYRCKRNDYAQAIKDTKRDHWEEWLENLEGEEVWAVGKMMSGGGKDGGRTRIPDLEVKDEITKRVKQRASTNEQKSNMFFETFFPKRVEQPAPAEQPRYPPPKWEFQTTTDEQIDRVIRTMKPYKASRSDSAPNSVFTHNRKILTPFLGPIYRATDTLKSYPEDWKTTETPILRKPGKSDYSAPGAYRPIVLSNGFARALNMCKTEDAAKMAEKEGLLPSNHFGGRPGMDTTDSIHMVVKTIKDAWRKKLVASVLFLDVKGAFPSVAMDTLIHELRMRGVPKEHVEWVRRRNTGRKTKIVFDDYKSAPFNVDDGLDQGDAQSLILYILYNANILIIPVLQNGEWTFIFVDDVALVTTGVDFAETHRKLKEMMEREGGILEWARRHNCTFGIEKFQLLDAGRKTITNPLGTGKRIPMQRPTLLIAGQRIKPVAHVKFLGINIDQGLYWKEQGAAAIAKGTAWLLQFGRLAKPSKGVAH